MDSCLNGRQVLSENERFAVRLRQAIRSSHGGRLPSSARLARELNQLDGWRRPLSSETVRRWIRGICVPELHRVPAIYKLLGRDQALLSFVLTDEPAQEASASSAGRMLVSGPKNSPQKQNPLEALLRLATELDADVVEALVFIIERSQRSGPANTKNSDNLHATKRPARFLRDSDSKEDGSRSERIS